MGKARKKRDWGKLSFGEREILVIGRVVADFRRANPGFAGPIRVWSDASASTVSSILADSLSRNIEVAHGRSAHGDEDCSSSGSSDDMPPLLDAEEVN